MAEVSVETKLAPASPIKTQFALGKDLRTGEVFAQEYGPGLKGQISVEEYMTEKETAVDAETGEILNNVTDFKAKEA